MNENETQAFIEFWEHLGFRDMAEDYLAISNDLERRTDKVKKHSDDIDTLTQDSEYADDIIAAFRAAFAQQQMLFVLGNLYGMYGTMNDTVAEAIKDVIITQNSLLLKLAFWYGFQTRKSMEERPKWAS